MKSKLLKVTNVTLLTVLCQVSPLQSLCSTSHPQLHPYQIICSSSMPHVFFVLFTDSCSPHPKMSVPVIFTYSSLTYHLKPTLNVISSMKLFLIPTDRNNFFFILTSKAFYLGYSRLLLCTLLYSLVYMNYFILECKLAKSKKPVDAQQGINNYVERMSYLKILELMFEKEILINLIS